MPVTNIRGTLIIEMNSRLDLEAANRGPTPTYRGPSFGEFIPDITLVSGDLVPLFSVILALGSVIVTGGDRGSQHLFLRLSEPARFKRGLRPGTLV